MRKIRSVKRLSRRGASRAASVDPLAAAAAQYEQYYQLKQHRELAAFLKRNASPPKAVDPSFLLDLVFDR